MHDKLLVCTYGSPYAVGLCALADVTIDHCVVMALKCASAFDLLAHEL